MKSILKAKKKILFFSFILPAVTITLFAFQNCSQTRFTAVNSTGQSSLSSQSSSSYSSNSDSNSTAGANAGTTVSGTTAIRTNSGNVTVSTGSTSGRAGTNSAGVIVNTNSGGITTSGSSAISTANSTYGSAVVNTRSSGGTATVGSNTASIANTKSCTVYFSMNNSSTPIAEAQGSVRISNCLPNEVIRWSLTDDTKFQPLTDRGDFVTPPPNENFQVAGDSNFRVGNDGNFNLPIGYKCAHGNVCNIVLSVCAMNSQKCRYCEGVISAKNPGHAIFNWCGMSGQ